MALPQGLSFWLILLAGALGAMGFATPAWTRYNNIFSTTSSNGLWEACTCTNRAKGQDDWLAATQAMASIGLICLAAALFMDAINKFVKRKCFSILIGFVCFAACICLTIAVSIYGAKASKHLHYSYAFVVMSAFAALGSGFVVILQNTGNV